MTKSTNQRRTAGSVIADIRKRYEEETQILLTAEAEVATHRTRVLVLQQILRDAEDDGRPDDV